MLNESTSKSSTSNVRVDSRPRQTRLWGRKILIKPKKKKKMKVKSEIPFARISASAIRDYLKCQKLFYYRHVLKMRLPTKAIQLVFGGAFHSGIEGLYIGEDPAEIFKKKFKISEIDKPPDMSQDDFELKFKESREDGISMMNEWKEKAQAIHKEYNIPWKGVSEQYFENWWVHPESGERMAIVVNGKVDRIADNADILEFKTSSKKYKQEDVDATGQGDVYCFARHNDRKLKSPKFFNGISDRMIYIVFLKGRKKDRIQVLETKRTVNDYVRIYETIDLIIDAVKKKQEKDYKYGEGFMHKYCDCRKYEENLLL